MQTQKVQTVPMIQAIKPFGESKGVPVDVPHESHKPVGVQSGPHISQFEPLPKDYKKIVNRIVKQAKSVQDVVRSVDEAFPLVQTEHGFKYSKVADIAVMAFNEKQKLH